jgi:aminopeptidase YwaD
VATVTQPVEMLASTHLQELCSVNPDRRPGSPGNDVATGYVAATLREAGWAVSEQTFDVLDWSGTAGTVRVGREQWAAHPSPYARGAEMPGRLVVARTLDELPGDLRGRVLLLLDDLAREPLTPLGYPFYGNDDHAALLQRLIEAAPRVVLAGTGTAPETAGAVEPFPLIEDGAFPIPTANLRTADAEALAEHADTSVRVQVSAHRWPSHARNVIARLGNERRRVVLTAHVDSKPGTPGALDNASGVVTLLLLAGELLSRIGTIALDELGVEIAILNGEDYYSAPGEVAYLDAYADTLSEIVLAVNVDAAGYRVGQTAFSLYGVDSGAADVVRDRLSSSPRLVEGEQWPSSDHMVFVQNGVPAVALTTDQLDVVLREVVHSSHDLPAQVDVTLLVEQARALLGLVEALVQRG